MVIIDLNYYVADQFMLNLYNISVEKYKVNRKNIYFNGPKAVYQKQKHDYINIDIKNIKTDRRLYISQ